MDLLLSGVPKENVPRFSTPLSVVIARVLPFQRTEAIRLIRFMWKLSDGK